MLRPSSSFSSSFFFWRCSRCAITRMKRSETGTLIRKDLAIFVIVNDAFNFSRHNLCACLVKGDVQRSPYVDLRVSNYTVLVIRDTIFCEAVCDQVWWCYRVMRFASVLPIDSNECRLIRYHSLTCPNLCVFTSHYALQNTEAFHRGIQNRRILRRSIQWSLRLALHSFKCRFSHETLAPHQAFPL